MTKEQLREQRDLRVEQAINMEKPDRVPFVPKLSGFHLYGYDITPYDAMMDARNIEPGLRAFLREYEPDAFFNATMYSIPVLEALDTQYLNWPGPTCRLPLSSAYQHLDGTYLEDEEYEEFIQDPTHTTLTKILPRKYKKLAGLKKLNFRDVFDGVFLSNLMAFNDPEVKEAIDALMEAGKLQKKRMEQQTILSACIGDEGFSTLNQGVLVIPFDAFADSVRGIIQTVMDTSMYTEELEQTINKLTEMNVEPLVKLYKAKGAKRVFIPLHCGVDEFMSPAAYERFYWPCLKKCIMTIIDNGMTPLVFCEGNYNTRLDVISDVPKGKVVYMFEKVDIQKVKDTVGKVACICGSVPTALLAFGKVEQVVNETKRQIDILAPGGGFMMDASIIIENASHENMQAWRETTLEYGKY